MNIALDMMGGDYAPTEVAKGLKLYLKEADERVKIFCIGEQKTLEKYFKEFSINDTKIEIVHAGQVIGYNEHPTKALKEKPESSISIGFNLLSKGSVDAFISAGNTGAMLVGSMFTIKAIDGVLRPTIPTILPRLSGKTGLLIDVGLNADCKPRHLDQFAVLGSLYAKHILQIENPKVGLLNIGEEEGKGNLLAQAAFPLLKENKHLNFFGNVEGRDVIKDTADVIVCDGFTGNIVLKLLESVYDIAVARNFQDDEVFSRFHYENYGGTPVLGISKPVIIGHGISNDVAFLNMLMLAQKMIATNLCEAITEAFSEIKKV